MTVRSVGLITYQQPHLKTEQVVSRIAAKSFEYVLFALPYRPRPPRDVLFRHRPDQSIAADPSSLSQKFSIPLRYCESENEISGCDVYLIFGGVLLSADMVQKHRVINCHAGIIPICRGLDAFKWAVLEGRPLGVTLHQVDERVDLGTVLAVEKTPVFKIDTIQTLADRHYQNEINLLSRFDEYLAGGTAPSVCANFEEPPKRRMPKEKEQEMLKAFPEFVKKYSNPHP